MGNGATQELPETPAQNSVVSGNGHAWTLLVNQHEDLSQLLFCCCKDTLQRRQLTEQRDYRLLAYSFRALEFITTMETTWQQAGRQGTNAAAEILHVEATTMRQREVTENAMGF